MVGPRAGNDFGCQAAKAAVLQLTKHAAGIFALSGVCVNFVPPAGINTQMREDYAAAHSEGTEAAAVGTLLLHYVESENITDETMSLANDSARVIIGTHVLVVCGRLCT